MMIKCISLIADGERRGCENNNDFMFHVKPQVNGKKSSFSRLSSVHFVVLSLISEFSGYHNAMRVNTDVVRYSSTSMCECPCGDGAFIKGRGNE